MILIRPAQKRGHFDHGWLNTYHTFSFADYHDPEFMGFRSLRVINEDRVEPGEGFGTHGHRDMEIVSYVLEGALAHKDSMGNGSMIQPGDVQYMSAGSGVQHSEFNHSDRDWVHFLQIWIMPSERGAKPRYGQKSFSDEEKLGRLRLVVSGDGRDGSIQIRQDADLYASVLQPNQSLEVPVRSGRSYWIQVARGGIAVNGKPLQAGDGASITDEPRISIQGTGTKNEFLLFDLS